MGKLAAFGALALAATCQSQSMPPPDEELVRGLARLARAGAHEVCNPAVLEEVLGIRIGPTTEFLRTDPPLQWQWTEQVTAPAGKPAIKYGRFDRSRARAGEHGVCRLTVEYEEFQLCDAPPGRLKSIVGAEPVRGVPRPHGSVYGYEYWFTGEGGHRTRLQLGTSESSCTSTYQLSAGGDWK